MFSFCKAGSFDHHPRRPARDKSQKDWHPTLDGFSSCAIDKTFKKSQFEWYGFILNTHFQYCYGIDGYVHGPFSSTILPVGNCRNKILGLGVAGKSPRPSQASNGLNGNMSTI